jgi:hypothetical protein
MPAARLRRARVCVERRTSIRKRVARFVQVFPWTADLSRGDSKELENIWATAETMDCRTEIWLVQSISAFQ